MSLTQAVAFLLSIFALWRLYTGQGICTLCSGRGRHRSDCPNAKHNTRDRD
jgi:hypothetical protein